MRFPRSTSLTGRRLSSCLVSVLTGLVRPFTWSYWFGPGCRMSYRFTRYVLALLYLYHANHYAGYFSAGAVDVDVYLSGRDPGMYHPLSFLCLFGTAPPPALFYKLSLLLLKFCPIALLLGFFSRLSLAGSMAGLFGLGIMFYSYELEWSHGLSPLLVTSLPFLFGPRHWDGFDGWLGRRRGQAWNASADWRARAAILATQLLVSLVFLNAAYYKCHAYGEGARHFLPWVFSDNMRNVIIRQHVLFEVPIAEPFRFIVSHEFAYKGLALANLLAQTLPFMALFLMRRPYLRFLCGLAMASEVIGLGVVMGIWNLHWLLFAFFFFDWDRLVFHREQLSGLGPQPDNEQRTTDNGQRTAPPVRASLEIVYAAVLAVLLPFNGYVLFRHTSQRPWTFPFTSYPMFSGVVAEQPYNEHLPYYIPVSGFEFDADKNSSAKSLHDNWLYYWGATWIPDVRALAKQIIQTLQTRNGCIIREMTAYRALLRVAEYPGYELRPVLKLPVYHYKDGRVQTVACLVQYDADAKRYYLDYHAYGFDEPRFQVKYFTEEGQGPFDLPGQAAGNRFYYTRPDCRKVIAVFEIRAGDGTPVLFGGPML